ncbi:glycosyltransferase [Litorimonas sp. RW-G-Af-16]|uniref:glycosyltransferase n=1 Tax=Litorimonas sp. RW-G-Af-16 TaxID=3241168 RepID=UPI00390C839D
MTVSSLIEDKTLCVIIPTYNASEGLGQRLSELESAARIVVADGGSTDDTIVQAIRGGAIIAAGASGRGQQLALGASHAGNATWMLFLHADNALPQDWLATVIQHMTRHPKRVGYFRYRANASGFWPRFMDFWVGMRCQWWGLPYGDQGLLISRDMYKAVGGYAEIPLFEDVNMIDRIKAKFGRTSLRPLSASLSIDVSKYAKDGVWATGQRNLKLLKAYRRGEDIEVLQARYRS